MSLLNAGECKRNGGAGDEKLRRSYILLFN